MTNNAETNSSSVSTTWVWKDRRIRVPAGGHKRGTTKSSRWFHLPPRKPREPLTIKISYRGGSECWYEIHARGSVGRYPGVVALHDVMRDINRA